MGRGSLAGLLALALLPCFWASCEADEDCPVPRAGAAMLQRSQMPASLASAKTGTVVEATEEEEKSSKRDKAADARFLMQASFGPTPASMKELEGKSYAQWIKDQMAVPAGLHRVYYRERVNPAYLEGAGDNQIYRSTPCDKGRFQNFAFTRKDATSRSRIIVGWRDIKVNNVKRTGRGRSDWKALGSRFYGYICQAIEEVGGEVHLSTSKDCRVRKNLKNLPLQVRGAVKVSGSLKEVKPGIVILEKTNGRCNLREPQKGKELHIEVDRKIYKYDSRFRCKDNTPENPISDVAGCTSIDAVNRGFCKLAPIVSQSQKRGLIVEVLEAKQVCAYVEEQPYPRPLATIHDAEIDHRPQGGSRAAYWPETHPHLTRALAYRWTGELEVRRPGKYTFVLGSDDGSMLHLDGELVIDNGGCHNFIEKEGEMELTRGRHKIIVDHHQGGGGQGIQLFWQGPDSGNKKEIVPNKALLTPARLLDPNACSVSCGSPGEVASKPELGHQLHMYLHTDVRYRDKTYDNRYVHRMFHSLTKTIVWTQLALYGEDQLRQRMAWALSQILVVSTQGVSDGNWPEMWVKYYDIFVRHAFGSFLDILKEVTYSPVMGLYLTHTDSSSYDFNGAFPNENYAREIMQLFSIGLDMLNPDGTKMTDEEGNVLHTYTNDGILSLSRVFSGFRRSYNRRKNMEQNHMNNFQDPMELNVGMHDIYPKPDLLGGYIGDGFPLCSDPLPKGSYLLKGARFEFVGLDSVSATLELDRSSKLASAICPGGKCESYAVELSESLACSGEECSTEELSVVKAFGAYYRYVHPPCVHLQFDEPTEDDGSREATSGMGDCVLDVSGPLQRTRGEVRLDTLRRSGAAREKECAEKCRAFGATGCRLSWWHHHHGCYAQTHMGPFKPSGKGSHSKCWNFGDTGRHGLSYLLVKKNVPACPEGTRVETLKECDIAARSMGLPLTRGPWIKWHPGHRIPGGCSYHRTQHFIMWNGFDAMFWGHYDHQSICHAHFEVAKDGTVLQSNGATSFAANWRSEQPSPGLHPINVWSHPVFDEVPSKEDALHFLKIGAYTPAEKCSICGGDVKVYGKKEIGIDSVFEVEGRFFRNMESVIVRRDAKDEEEDDAFRNPPVFLWSLEEPNALSQIQAEVHATLEHLFRHPNCPVFVSKLLIQRFTTSNPSPAYLEAVQAAFKSGAYGGVTYSGKYGDLGATLAAILLHPEAREEERGASTTINGALREPLLKVLHLMRSMEYKDLAGDYVVFKQLHDMIGEFPYKAPTVFNHYHAGYELPELGLVRKQKQEGVLAPEFQIFTPPYFVGYLNGIHSIVDLGVTGWCWGRGLTGIGAFTYDERHRFLNTCPQGRLEYKGQGSKEEVLEHLDVMLTGGRLSPKAKEVVSIAYDSAPEDKKVQDAQKALVMTAEFNTMGAPLPLEGERDEYKVPEGGNVRPYKAVVLIYMGGGADTWNLVIPQACEQYNDYRAMRTDLALEPSEVNEISTKGQRCSKYGVHGSMPFLKELYEDGHAAFITNVGNLPEPTSLQDFRSNKAMKCFNLFSHGDQANGAMTLKCQQNGASAHGAGGRMGDALAGGKHKFKTASYSMSGSAVWSMGAETIREIIGGGGAAVFKGFDQWDGAIKNITAQYHGNQYAEVYADAFRTTIAQSLDMAEVLGKAKLSSTHDFRGSGLEQQFLQVAKLIAAREGRKAERDFFFVATGGFDMHQDVKRGMVKALAPIDKAIKVFVEELKAQGVWENVVITTESEFARSLTSNGGGSDHAWAGQHVIMGGSLRGGRIFNRYPASLTKNAFDLGRGRLIPEFPWESVIVPVAEWLGVEKHQYPEVFPNLKHFNSSHLIPRRELFKS